MLMLLVLVTGLSAVQGARADTVGQGGKVSVVRSLLPEAMRKTCLEATNGCQVCVVLMPSGMAHCSLPGIACQPVAWSCRMPIEKRPIETGEKDER